MQFYRKAEGEKNRLIFGIIVQFEGGQNGLQFFHHRHQTEFGSVGNEGFLVHERILGVFDVNTDNTQHIAERILQTKRILDGGDRFGFEAIFNFGGKFVNTLYFHFIPESSKKFIF